MSSNIFDVLGDVSLNVAKNELAEAKVLQQQEETLTAIKISSDLEQQANRYLLDKTENYSYDGRLVADAEQFIADQENAALNSITNENVRKRVAAASTKLKTDFTTKADTLQTQKHLEKQKLDWGDMERNDISEIIASGGDELVLLSKLEKLELNKDGFSAGIKDELLPATQSRYTEAALLSRMSALDLSLARKELTPKQAAEAVDDLLKTVVGQPELYKLNADKMLDYGTKLNNVKSQYLTTYTQAAKDEAKGNLKAAIELFGQGKISGSEAGVAQMSAFRYLTTSERAEFEEDLVVANISNRIVGLAKQGNDDQAQSEMSQFDIQISKARNSGNFDLAAKLDAGKEKVSERLVELDEQFTFHAADFYSSDPMVSILKSEGRQAEAVNLMAQKSGGKIDIAHFSPLRTDESTSIRNDITSRLTDPAGLRQYALNLRNQYSGTIPSLKGADLWQLTTKQLGREIMSSLEDIDSDLKPDQAVVIALQYIDNPPVFDELIKNIIADDSILEPNVKRDIKSDVQKKFRDFHKTFNQLGDVLPFDLPSTSLFKLAQRSAVGEAARGGAKNRENGKFAKSAFNNIVETQWSIVPGVNGRVSIPREQDHPIIKRALKDRSVNFSMAKKMLIDTGAIDDAFKFNEIIQLAGIKKEVTEQELKNRASFVPINGVYRLYLKYQTETYPAYVMENGKPKYFDLAPQQFIDTYLLEKSKRQEDRHKESTRLGVLPG